MIRVAAAVAALFLLAARTASASPIQVLTNGNFETGTFAGWTVNDQGGGNFLIDTPGTTTPISSHPTVGSAANGSFYAVSDQPAAGVHALRQTFTVAPGTVGAILAFDMFVNDWDAGPIVNPAGLTTGAGPNQHARVDILTAAAGAFDTGATVLGNFYLGVDGGVDPHAFTHYSFNITSIVGGGGTFQLRFAEVDNQFFLNQGVDNVSITADADADAVPEPGTLVLLGTSLAGVGLRRWRQRRRS